MNSSCPSSRMWNLRWSRSCPTKIQSSDHSFYITITFILFINLSILILYVYIWCNVMEYQWVLPFLSTFLAMYLLNWSQEISFLPKPATLFTTSWISSSLKLYFSWSDILLRSSTVSVYFCSGSTSANIARLPASLNGLPIFSVMRCRKVSKSTHSPARSLLTALRASKMSLNLRSKPRVLAVLRISETSQCLRLSQ